MITINHTLLSEDALDNLILDVITRQGTDYGEHEMDFVKKKAQLLQKLKLGEITIMYDSEEGFCNIATAT